MAEQASGMKHKGWQPLGYTSATVTVGDVTLKAEGLTVEPKPMPVPDYLLFTDSLRRPIAESPTVTGTVIFNDDNHALWHYLTAGSETAIVTVRVRREGELDPATPLIRSLRGQLRQMWRILRYEFRKAAGLLVPSYELVIPNVVLTLKSHPVLEP